MNQALVGIELSAKTVLSYPMAHNRVPVVDRLELRNFGPAQDGVKVRIAVCDGEGPISHPYEQLVDLADGGVTVLNGVDLKLNAAAMLQIDEHRPGTVEVRISREHEVLAERVDQVRLLAARHWLVEPLNLALEMLPSFVMPNDPSVVELMGEAAQLLERATGSPSLQGYQSGSERADQIVQAIFEAMQARQIRYAEPPASWGRIGQKVRTPQDVLDGRTGTCLDTTVVLAAALEQAGIRPLLWVVNGHAFLGYWRDEAALDSTVHTDVADIVNLIDLGLIRLVETTLLTARERPASFAETDRPPYTAYLHGDLEAVFGVVDVWTARQNDILPLPARRRTDEGVQVIEYHPQRHSNPPLHLGPRAPRQDGEGAGIEQVPARVQQWKNALLDLSLRNRLINFSARNAIGIAVPDGHISTIEDLVHARSVTLLPADNIDDVHRARGIRAGADLPDGLLGDLLVSKAAVFTDLPGSSYPSKMRSLAYKARTIVEETGANNLYLAFGSLVWDVEGKPLRSPLILVPVNLRSARGSAYRLELDDSGGSTPNYCLLEKLRQLQNLRVPGLENPVEDEHGIDLDAALDAMRRAIAEKGLPFRVEATVDLAVLQFAKFRLWKDLDDHWASLMHNALVRHLVESPTEPFEDSVPTPDEPDLEELDAACPIPADASQLEAIRDACAGRTFVLEGPPGTGKSQTITNLLTRAVAEGKRVLFVAEKRAALDVVQSRLESVGLSPFCLDLHDKASRPTAVRAQIKLALEHAVAVDHQGLAAQQEDLRSARRGLARYATRLHEPNGAGLSFYSARTSLLALGDDIAALPVPQSLLGPEAREGVSRIRRTLIDLPDTADPARPRAEHPWGFLASPDPRHDVSAIATQAREVEGALTHLPPTGAVAAVLTEVRTPADLRQLGHFLTWNGVPLDVLDQARSDAWNRASAALGVEIAAFVAAAHPGLDVATPAALELPLGDIHAEAQTAAASGFFGRKKRLRAVLERLAPALRPGAQIKPKQVPVLTSALLQVQGAVLTLAGKASGVAGISVPETWNPLTEDGRALVNRQIEWLNWAAAAVDERAPTQENGRFTTALRRFLQASPPVDEGTANAVGYAGEAFQRLLELTATDVADLQDWLTDAGLLEKWQRTSPARNLADEQCLSLRRWLAFLGALEPLAEAKLHDAHRLLRRGEINADEAVGAFDRGLALASSAERRTSTGLDTFDPEAHDRTVFRFTRSAQAVRQQMSTAVPHQILQARAFHANAGRGQVGALQRELAKQRRGLGVRALLETYGDLITQVMPCILVSPDSVARFFPVGSQTFDLVVFDEASQIRVAESVGAMGRARSVVVVGDSKQMPPTSFAESRTGSDEELSAEDALVVEDEESILTESVQARVPQRWLSWHYRSQDETLIAFSNQNYYESRLSSFPAPRSRTDAAVHEGYGVYLVRVDGEFHRSGKGRLLRTNPVEAEAIVSEIRRRFAASPERTPSLGVVTFNQQQRAHIESLIRDSEDDRLIEALDGTEEEGLFIKNLENVQGDERDAILFSTAFSVNEKGVLPLNFGPLTRGGGERRLNVAVTRARRQVIIFSSFDPSQLRSEDTQSLGIKHLRGYLELAAHGPKALGLGSDGSAALPDRHRDEIAQALRDRRLPVCTDVGLSDFRIDLVIGSAEDPEQPAVAVLLDGDGWAERRTVGDRDGLPSAVLAGLLGWPAVERVWLPAWLADRPGTLDRLEEAARDTGTALSRTSAPVAAAPLHQSGTLAEEPLATFARQVEPPNDGFDEALAESDTTTLPGESEFEEWEVPYLGDRSVLDDLPATWAAQQVRTAVCDAVEAEGPIHLDRLARLVASAFGLNRVNRTRVDAILQHLPQDLWPDLSEAFAWPTTLVPSTWNGFRRSYDASQRPIEHVSKHEIVNAMAALCRESAGIHRGELLRESLSIFGGRRLTASIQARLEESLDHALSTGRLAQNGSGLIFAAGH